MASISRLICTAVILATVLVTVIIGRPVRPEEGRWVNPCGGSIPVHETVMFDMVPPIDIIPGPIEEELDNLHLTSKMAVAIANEVKVYIKRHHLFNGMAEELNNETLWELTDFPELESPLVENMTVDDLLFKEITRISSVGVFLEQAIADATYGYTEWLKELENKYVHMLCRMEQILKSNGHQLPEPVSRSVMPDRYRFIENTTESLEISHQHIRNYIIITRTATVLSSFGEGIVNFTTTS